MAPARQSRPAAQTTLKRSLSLPLTTFYGLGNILGAGIYVLIGKVALHANIYAPLSFVLAALLAALTAFTYAELSSRYPFSAGEAVYVEAGTGSPALAALVGGLIILVGVVSSAAIVRGFAGYLQVFVATPELPTLLLCVLVLGALAAWGITESVTAAALVTLIEIGGLLLIIAVAAPTLGDRPAAALATPPPLLGAEAWYGIFLGGFLAFFAFTGFEDMVNVAEEVQQPEKNLPRAILLSLVVATLLYFAVALVAVNSVPVALLGQSEAPLAVIYEQATGRAPVVITLISLFAVINGALIQIIMVSRVAYGMARRGWLPAIFGYVHPLTRTPLFGTAVVSGLILGMALWLPTETLARATSFFLLLIFSLVNFSLWRLKRNAPQPPGIICVPAWLPAVGLGASLLFVVVQAVLELTGS
jgi:amino acid transporter